MKLFDVCSNTNIYWFAYCKEKVRLKRNFSDLNLDNSIYRHCFIVSK